MTTSTIAVPSLTAGTWTIDPSHSDVSFSVRHLMVSKVRGSFRRFSGELRIEKDLEASSVAATIDMASIDTRDPDRDAHLRSVEFFDVERYPMMTFRSTGIRRDGDRFVLAGDLEIHGITRPVDLTVEFNGVTVDPLGGRRAGFSATTEINRRDFGIDFHMPLDGGGAVVGDKVNVQLEIEAILA
jgi:polyisoprenoid-binding protein YceI